MRPELHLGWWLGAALAAWGCSPTRAAPGVPLWDGGSAVHAGSTGSTGSSGTSGRLGTTGTSSATTTGGGATSSGTTTGGTTAGGTTTGGTTGTTGPSAAMCTPCLANSDCGAGHCAFDSTDFKTYCSPPCDANGSCQSGACTPLFDSSGAMFMGCYPASGTCGSGSTSGGTTGSPGCQACTAGSQCPLGDHCLQKLGGSTARYCVPGCSGPSDTSCPTGYTCDQISGTSYGCRADPSTCP